MKADLPPWHPKPTLSNASRQGPNLHTGPFLFHRPKTVDRIPVFETSIGAERGNTIHTLRNKKFDEESEETKVSEG